MEPPQTVMFFANGNTAASTATRQIPDLQVPWIGLYIEFLKSQGIDPSGIQFLMPNGDTARWDTESDNWSVQR